MDSAWIGTISALLGAALAGGISLVRDWRSDARQEVRDESQRRHEVAERRFDARRDAYVRFASALQQANNSTSTFVLDHHGLTPGEEGHEGPHHALGDALDQLLVVGPQELIEVAEIAALYANEWAFGPGPRTGYDAEGAAFKYTTLARKLLKFDDAL